MHLEAPLTNHALMLSIASSQIPTVPKPVDTAILEKIVSQTLDHAHHVEQTRFPQTHSQLFDLDHSFLGEAKGAYHCIDTGSLLPLR